MHVGTLHLVSSWGVSLMHSRHVHRSTTLGRCCNCSFVQTQNFRICSHSTGNKVHPQHLLHERFQKNIYKCQGKMRPRWGYKTGPTYFWPNKCDIVNTNKHSMFEDLYRPRGSIPHFASGRVWKLPEKRKIISVIVFSRQGPLMIAYSNNQ